jgi:hypothetical protein
VRLSVDQLRALKELAIERVDVRHGYTLKFAFDKAAHRHDYLLEYEKLLEQAREAVFAEDMPGRVCGGRADYGHCLCGPDTKCGEQQAHERALSRPGARLLRQTR